MSSGEDELNMAYYHIKTDDSVDDQKLFTIVFPWGKYKYKCLPVGIKIAWILFASLGNDINTCENLHVEEQHQVKISLPKNEQLVCV
jgi:hypothetical protein